MPKGLVEKKISIGDIVISISSDNAKNINLNPSYNLFVTKKRSQVKWRVEPFCPSRVRQKKLVSVFKAGKTWSMKKNDDTYEIKTTSAKGVFSSDFKSGQIYLLEKDDTFPSYPMDELLMINLLARQRGMMMHACAVKDREQGMLFLGSSGAGKSTLGRLWKKHTEALILSDDRVIIRYLNGKFWMYGTPWLGEEGISSCEKASLDKIFFLKKSTENYIQRIAPGEALLQLLTCAFTPRWDKAGMGFCLEFFSQLCEKYPIYELGLLPDRSIINFLHHKIDDEISA